MRLPDPARGALAVWVLVLLLGVLFAGELRWAAGALPAYLGHGFPPLRERQYAAEALRLANEEQDLAAALALMEASAAIDPTAFPLLHAELERRAGRADAALALYERANFVDPSDARAWLGRAELLQELGRTDEARAVLREGLAWFSRNLRMFRPVPDPGVAPRYNAKAERTYTELRNGVGRLQAALARASRR
ncbi:MAG: tetratricopeptide repeat protein [Myxococcota bacterium]